MVVAAYLSPPSPPQLLHEIAAHAGNTEIRVLPTPRPVRQFVTQVASGAPDLS